MTRCPHCGKEINAASILGAAGKGKRKAFSEEERLKRRERMKEINRKRKLQNAQIADG